MKKCILLLLTITFLVTNSSYAATTNFNSQSAKFYLNCPYCAKVTKLQTDAGVDKKCSNEKCNERLDSQQILSSGDEAYKLARQIKAERVKKANDLKIKEDNGVKCQNCMRNQHLDRYEVLAIVEGRRDRTLLCKGCGQGCDLIEGITFYEIQKQKEEEAFMRGVAVVAVVALAGVAIAASSQGGGGGYNPPPVYRAPQPPVYNMPQPIAYIPTVPMPNRPAARAIMPISQGGSYTANRIGNFDYVSGPGGYSGSGNRIGNFYYYNDNKDGSYSSQSIGNFDYTSGSGGYSGSGNKIGNFYYYNDNRGGSYTTQKIGQFDYVSGPDGYSGSGQQIGDFYYYRDNK